MPGKEQRVQVGVETQTHLHTKTLKYLPHLPHMPHTATHAKGRGRGWDEEGWVGMGRVGRGWEGLGELWFDGFERILFKIGCLGSACVKSG